MTKHLKFIKTVAISFLLFGCTKSIPQPTSTRLSIIDLVASPSIPTSYQTMTPSITVSPMCTPPPCVQNEVIVCNEDCQGGCGAVCATLTPTQGPLYIYADLVGVSFPSGKMMISFDIPEISGEFYGLIGEDEYECDILFPEDRPDRLFCLGPLQEMNTSQQISVHRSEDGILAFALKFHVPGSASIASGSTGGFSCWGPSCDCGPESQVSCCPGWVKEIVGPCDISNCSLTPGPECTCDCLCGYLWQADCSLIYTGVFGSCDCPD